MTFSLLFRDTAGCGVMAFNKMSCHLKHVGDIASNSQACEGDGGVIKTQ